MTDFVSKSQVMEHGNLLLLWLAVATAVVFLQIRASRNAQGFISLACGANSNFTDRYNISWVPDDAYISAGNKSIVSFTEGNSTVTKSLRFFPDSQRDDCYKIPVKEISLVLVRSTFYYKNYDGMHKPPRFQVSLGTTMITTVNLSHHDPWVEEIISADIGDTLLFCLYSRPEGGTPLISSLEIRPLPARSYSIGTGDDSNKILRKKFRINCGYNASMLRYPYDSYDRTWDIDQSFSPKHLSGGFDIPVKIKNSGVPENPPEVVLQSARVLVRKDILAYNFPLVEEAKYFVIVYFAGILPLQPTFHVLINGDIIRSNLTLQRAVASTVSSSRDMTSWLNITIHNVSFHPQINALEIYQIIDIPVQASGTQALVAIQNVYRFNLGWENDPCYPVPWKGVQCDEAHDIISLDLSNMDLSGPFAPAFGDLLDLQTLDLHNNSLTGHIENIAALQNLQILNLSFNKLNAEIPNLSTLTSLQNLDLQNNSFQGLVPESLGQLSNLQLLNLENNQLHGPLPSSLNRTTLVLRTSGNLCLVFPGTKCSPQSPPVQTPRVTDFNVPKSRSHHRAIIGGVVGGAAFLLLALTILLFWYSKKYKSNFDGTTITREDMKNWNAAKRFSFKEIKMATNNFKDTIGQGSFGSVYLGKLRDGQRVAVKVRSDQSQLAADSFINEVFLLSQIHHPNLVSLEGFCQESKHQILVYEYLSGGSLSDHLHGSKGKRKLLDWRKRLKIAVDSATGIEYLHSGCDPRVIHRDVKCSNVLLDSDLNAKVCDFGLSKQIVQADASHVTTVVKGTAGYLDPEYYSTQQLTEKSDVYSFGVVLLELICGREPLIHTGAPDSYNLVLWAKPYLQAGDYNVIDSSLHNYNPESLRKVALIATRCVERDASQRPTMTEVLTELKAALAIEETENPVTE